MSADFSRTAILLAQALEVALNQARKLDIDQGQAFNALPESVIALQIAPLKSAFYCLLGDGHISVQTHLSGESDAQICAQALDWMGLPSSADLNAFELHGDTELAKQFLQALAALEIDWEEHLASITGDFIAFKVGHGVRSYLDLKRRQRDSIEQTLKEYLQFEIEAVPTASQVQRFNHEVSDLAERLAQIEARLAKFN